MCWTELSCISHICRLHIYHRRPRLSRPAYPCYLVSSICRTELSCISYLLIYIYIMDVSDKAVRHILAIILPQNHVPDSAVLHILYHGCHRQSCPSYNSYLLIAMYRTELSCISYVCRLHIYHRCPRLSCLAYFCNYS